jgi:ABC-type polysaccharide/polyol phosphate transport system ATPase subunit
MRFDDTQQLDIAALRMRCPHCRTVGYLSADEGYESTSMEATSPTPSVNLPLSQRGIQGDNPPDNNIVIIARDLGKCYNLWNNPKDRLKHSLRANLARFCPIPPKSYHTEFWALRDVSFEVKKGEALGIIGRNGSGKSTLLQMIAGTLSPTLGEVKTKGRVAALLELGSGFNPEFTGRENVFMNGSILGLSHQEMEDRFDEIAAFADIGDFMYQPVKAYSSGMFVRLAFAVQACVEPDVLIVDEALAVGDIFFNQKCFQHIRSIIEKGTTFLFVTHDTAAVQNLCDRTILLDKGISIFEGPSEEATSRYFSLFSEKAPASTDREIISHLQSTQESNGQVERLKAEILTNNILPLARSQHGAGGMKIVAAAFVNEHGAQSMSVEMLKTATIHVLIRAHRAIIDPSSGIHLYDRMNNLVFAAGTRQLRVPLDPFEPGEERILSFEVTMAVQPGEYTFSVGCAEPSPEGGPNVGYIQNRHEGLGPIVVWTDMKVTLPFYGIGRLPMDIFVHD